MALSPRDSYAAADVHTAPPQKLQLMLIEAALRSAERARRHWRDGRKDLALGAIVHAQAVLGQMLAAIDRPAGGQLAEKVSAIYDFIFRKLVEAGQQHDEQSLADAVRILEIERETWRMLCEQIAAQGARRRLIGRRRRLVCYSPARRRAVGARRPRSPHVHRRRPGAPVRRTLAGSLICVLGAHFPAHSGATAGSSSTVTGAPPSPPAAGAISSRCRPLGTG